MFLGIAENMEWVIFNSLSFYNLKLVKLSLHLRLTYASKISNFSSFLSQRKENVKEIEVYPQQSKNMKI